MFSPKLPSLLPLAHLPAYHQVGGTGLGLMYVPAVVSVGGRLYWDCLATLLVRLLLWQEESSGHRDISMWVRSRWGSRPGDTWRYLATNLCFQELLCCHLLLPSSFHNTTGRWVEASVEWSLIKSQKFSPLGFSPYRSKKPKDFDTTKLLNQQNFWHNKKCCP